MVDYILPDAKKYKGLKLVEESGVDVSKMREAIFELRKEYPKEMRKKIENEEWVMTENFQKQNDGSFIDAKGNPPTETRMDAVNRRIDMRMQSESKHMQDILGD